MTTEAVGPTLIEHYLRTRGRRYFRGQHDGEFFFVVSTHPQPLHVHLEISPAGRDVFTMRIAPACYFPATDHDRLIRFAETWNQQCCDISAFVHGSSDPQRIGMTAQRSQQIPERVQFDDFAALADRAIAAAIDLFNRLPPEIELPPAARPLLRDAG